MWKAVLVDDQFPTRARKWVLGRCFDDHEIWVSLLEKAYAKVNGGFDNIILGLVKINLKTLVY